MQNVKQLLPTVDNKSLTLPTGRTLSTSDPSEAQFTSEQQNLVGYFYLRLQTIWGTKYDAQFADKRSLQMSKREWAGNICKFDRDALHRKLEMAKVLKGKGDKGFEWPDISKILNLKAGISPDGTNSAAYRLIDNDTLKLPSEVNRDYGRNVLEQMKANFAAGET